MTRSTVWKLDQGHPTSIPTLAEVGNGDVWSGTAANNILRTKGGETARWRRNSTSSRVGTGNGEFRLKRSMLGKTMATHSSTSSEKVDSSRNHHGAHQHKG